MKNSRIQLSLFIPVFNEEEIIRGNTEKLIGYLDTLYILYEIVICSNGSTDRTDEFGRALEDANPEKVRFFTVSEKGVGRALRSCIPRFQFPYVLSLDMDLSVDLSFIADVLDLLNGYDVVVGSKKTGNQTRTIIRKLGSGLYIFIARLLLNLSYTDYSLGAKVYKKAILERYAMWIDDYGTDYVINIVYNASKDGYRIIEIPVTCFDTRASRFSLFSEGLYRYKKIFLLWLKYRKYRLQKDKPQRT